jgi:hypothetical protein
MAHVVNRETDRRTVLRQAVSIIGGSLVIMVVLVFAGCKDSEDVGTTPANTPPVAASPVTNAPPSKGLIKATPNPVPAGPGDLGKTMISWDTGNDEGPVVVAVAAGNEAEVGFAGGARSGSMEAPWIQSAAPYDFRLYVGAGAAKKLIDHVTVTRNK